MVYFLFLLCDLKIREKLSNMYKLINPIFIHNDHEGHDHCYYIMYTKINTGNWEIITLERGYIKEKGPTKWDGRTDQITLCVHKGRRPIQSINCHLSLDQHPLECLKVPFFVPISILSLVEDLRDARPGPIELRLLHVVQEQVECLRPVVNDRVQQHPNFATRYLIYVFNL